MEEKITAEKPKKPELTPVAEDYLRMIYLMSFEDDGGGNPVRICALAQRLGVSPSSVSRMAQSMALWGYLDFRRYGYITMTDEGKAHGEYLVLRHDTVKRFFSELCGGTTDSDTDKIEHFVSRRTVDEMIKRLGCAEK